MQTIITNLKRASVEIILLSLLCEEPMYGYQLAQEIKKRSNGQFSLMEASMYPVLGRLKEQGDVTMETVQKRRSPSVSIIILPRWGATIWRR